MGWFAARRLFGFVTRHPQQKRLLSYRRSQSSSNFGMRIERDGSDNSITVHPALGKHSATVIFMHGLGDSAEGFATVAEQFHLAMPHVKFILPTATNIPVTINGGYSMPAWYDISGITDRANEECKGIEASVERIHKILDKEHELGLPYSRIALAGFSQGGAMSLFTGFQLPLEKRVAGLAAIAAYLPATKKFKLTSGLEDLPVLHLHGKVDPVVRPDWATSTRDHLQALGSKTYSLHFYDNVPHTVTEPMIIEAMRFLGDLLKNDAAYTVKPKAPKSMSVKELKEAIRDVGLLSEAKGFAEKSEFVALLQRHYDANGIQVQDTI